jgi:hypothetical protein
VNDTPSELSQLLAGRYRDRTPGERVRMAAAMFRVATTLARAGIRSRHGDATDSELRRLLLRRLYGGELTEVQLAEIALSWQRPLG